MSATVVFSPAHEESWSIEAFPATAELLIPAAYDKICAIDLPAETIPRITITLADESYLRASPQDDL